MSPKLTAAFARMTVERKTVSRATLTGVVDAEMLAAAIVVLTFVHRCSR